MVEFFQSISVFNLFLVFLAITIVPLCVFILVFRDLFFESSFKYRIEEYNTPQKDMVMKFLRFPSHIHGHKVLSGKWIDHKLYKNKIVIVAGEAAPRVYDQDFYDRLKIMKQANVNVTMIAGPVFLKNDKGVSYALQAAHDGLLNLSIFRSRFNSHFRANLYTGELYYEYPHAPNEKHRMSVHFIENRYEVKSYLRLANKLLKKSKPYNKCIIGSDYLLLSTEDLENIKKYIDMHGMKDFNDYTVSDMLQIKENACPQTA